MPAPLYTMIGHAFVSSVGDGAKAEQVQPQRDWNDEHAFIGGNKGSILVRDTTTTKPGASWVQSVASGQVLVSQGVGSLPAWGSSVNALTINVPNIQTTSTDGLSLVNPTPSTVGITVQRSPRLRLTGTAWNSVGAVSEVDDWTIENRPVTTAGTTTSTIFFSRQIAAGGYTDIMNLNSGGTLSVTHKIAVTDAVNAEFTMAAAGFIDWLGRTVLTAPADGQLLIQNNAQTNFTSLQFGGTTNAFPELKRSGTSLLVRLADDSADGGLTTGTLTVNTTATITTSTTTPLVIGGTGTTSTLTLVPTSNAGSTTGADIVFLTQSGGTELLRLTHAGLLTFEGTTAAQSALKSAGVTNMSIRLADDSGYADLNARSIISNVSGSGTAFQAPAAAQIFWTGRADLTSPADAKVTINNNALTAGVTLDATTADTLKVQVKAANAYGTIDAGTYKLSGTALQATQSAPGDPVGTTDTATGKMMGLAVAFTPSSTRVLIIISGSIWNQTNADGAAAQITTGTGAAPTNGAAITGTARGNSSTLTNGTTANQKYPFTCSAIVTGLSAGVAIWIDLQVKAITGGTANVGSLSVQAYDLL